MILNVSFNILAGDAEYDPALFPIPSVNQFGAYNYFYVKEGSDYTIIVGKFEKTL